MRSYVFFDPYVFLKKALYLFMPGAGGFCINKDGKVVEYLAGGADRRDKPMRSITRINA